MKDYIQKINNDYIVPALNLFENCCDYPTGHDLILGTGAQESKFIAIRQKGYSVNKLKNGAFGLFQEELATHNDTMSRLKIKEPKIYDLVQSVKFETETDAENLMYNTVYSVLSCRCVYLMKTNNQPPSQDGISQNEYIAKMAAYYKKYYNTVEGDATEQQFIDNYKEYIIGN